MFSNSQDSLDSPADLLTTLHRAYAAAGHLAAMKGGDRSRALQVMAEVLKDQQDDILEANTLDLEASREMAVPDLVLEWLKLTPERIEAVVKMLQRLSELADPTQQMLTIPYSLSHSQSYCQLMPLGVIALVYEAFPELGAIAAGLCIRTGNSIVLRGSSEASHSNQAIASTLKLALQEAGLPTDAIGWIPTDQGDSIRELVTQDAYVNLVIPYGRVSLVNQVIRQATVPVLKTAIGNCYLYWSPSGSLDLARSMILDSHQSEPDPVNAVEKVLISTHQDPNTLQALWRSLREKGFRLRGDAGLVAEFPDLALAEESEWQRPYLDGTIAFCAVSGLEEAIAFMNRHSSGHADCLVTESYWESHQFALHINSATTYINASPRFYRNPKQGSPIALGMSNQKGHRRGLITLETLTTLKYVVQGSG